MAHVLYTLLWVAVITWFACGAYAVYLSLKMQPGTWSEKLRTLRVGSALLGIVLGYITLACLLYLDIRAGSIPPYDEDDDYE